MTRSDTPLTDANAVHTIDFFGGFATDEVDWAPGTKARDLERAARALADAIQFGHRKEQRAALAQWHSLTREKERK